MPHCKRRVSALGFGPRSLSPSARRAEGFSAIPQHETEQSQAKFPHLAYGINGFYRAVYTAGCGEGDASYEAQAAVRAPRKERPLLALSASWASCRDHANPHRRPRRWQPACPHGRPSAQAHTLPPALAGRSVCAAKRCDYLPEPVWPIEKAFSKRSLALSISPFMQAS